jgi:hypothetical protein
MDMNEIAKTVIGELQKAARTDFETALKLQAAARVLLPSAELEGVAAPKIFPNDPMELQQLQGVVKDRLETRREATEDEKSQAVITLRNIAPTLGNQEMAAVIINSLQPSPGSDGPTP